MSLTMADPSSESPLPSMATSSVLQQTTTAVATAAAAPVAGDNSSSQLPASATVMIVIGVVLGLVGVASVITLIWWMRRRHLNRLRTDSYPAQNLYPPAPPPKTAAVNKALPNINVASANAGYRAAPPPPNRTMRSNTVGSVDRDKALPVKPVESVWSPSDRPNKSPALASAQEMRSPRFTRPHDEEMAMSRTRSDSTSRDPTVPQNFI